MKIVLVQFWDRGCVVKIVCTVLGWGGVVKIVCHYSFGNVSKVR